MTKSIGSQDLEFYYGGTVLKLAKLISGKDENSFSELHSSTRTNYLNLANKLIRNLINESDLLDEIQKIKNR
jgi:hypothetical protein